MWRKGKDAFTVVANQRVPLCPQEKSFKFLQGVREGLKIPQQKENGAVNSEERGRMFGFGKRAHIFLVDF